LLDPIRKALQYSAHPSAVHSDPVCGFGPPVGGTAAVSGDLQFVTKGKTLVGGEVPAPAWSKICPEHSRWASASSPGAKI